LLNSSAGAADLSAVSDPIETLRQAVAQSPDNAPLRRHLGDLLSAAGCHEEALGEYREALALDPSDELRLALARAFLSVGRTGEAAVLVDVVLDAGGSSEALVLKSRLLLNQGDLEGARDAYRQAVAVDPELADPELADLLVAPGETAGEQREREPAAARSGERVDPDRTAVTFADVGGMEDVKEEIRLKIIHPFQHPELYAAYGKSAGGGVLLYGPPGCGKTHVARATAGELGSSFLWVGLEDVLSMWFGESEQNLHELFEQARRSEPCVLDEVDALGARRSDMRTSPGRQLINQFLVELDGVSTDNAGILVLAATNAPWHVDDAFRRPGRFDRVVFVPPPDRGARREIMRIHLEGRLQEQIDLDQIAARTEGYSGADLSALVDVAVEAKLAASIQDGVPRPIATEDLLHAARKRKPTTAEWFQTARNYALHANQAGSYDAILEYLGRR
jgi:SpoVK/Ycf46/Vps4 family AAA+-type ATPase